MGCYIAIGPCIACGRVIQFNPNHVPSLRIRGVREPLCRACAERWNALHPEHARAIHPEAYEPDDEANLITD